MPLQKVPYRRRRCRDPESTLDSRANRPGQPQYDHNPRAAKAIRRQPVTPSAPNGRPTASTGASVGVAAQVRWL